MAAPKPPGWNAFNSLARSLVKADKEQVDKAVAQKAAARKKARRKK